MKEFAKYLNLLLVCIVGITLIGFQIKPLGWLILALSFSTLLLCSRSYAKDALLVHISLLLLGIAPIHTDISWSHIIMMGAILGAAVAIPYIVSKKIYKNKQIRFPLHHGRAWYRKEILYIFITASVSYLLLPYYLKATGAYLNWPDADSLGEIGRLFLGTNALGIWDELFFINVVLSILRRHFSFWVSNAAQAIMFTSFLHELGFISWIFVVIYLFAILQGYIFKQTESLLYIITIHLTLDFVLFLALVNAHNPNTFAIFAY